VFDGLGRSVRCAKGIAQVVVDAGGSRLEAKGLLVAGDGLLELTEPEKRDAQVAMDIDTIRLQGQAALQMLHGQSRLALVQTRHPQAGSGINGLGFQRQCPPENDGWAKKDV